MSSQQLVWLITDPASGSELVIAALERGEKVIATARGGSLSQLEDLKALGADVLELDVTVSLDELCVIAEKAIDIHGRIDVLVNNAGYALLQSVEEATPQETFNQFNTNVFGPLNVARAFLPYMRERRTGTFVFLGSIGSWTPQAFSGVYNGSKFAIRGISESLHQEIAPMGLRSICFDFGFFRTNFLSPGHRILGKAGIAGYQEIAHGAAEFCHAYDRQQPGDPKKGVRAVLDIVRGEGVAEGKAFPTDLLLGSDCRRAVQDIIQKAVISQEEWNNITISTDI
ncbi:hypothetical protein IW261DRAFT_1404863 [Armillaria novae-zelandiae]|uniref:NAD(P)-binding protein n=1 Tax=Armillaria novae-zelandiae TaxID=153914 RepID=A0AA39TXG0_9AGAR|nr:hypothetical protein IW261DRAFT_1404863 [Armillaria novae-zelandiae]